MIMPNGNDKEHDFTATKNGTSRVIHYQSLHGYKCYQA